MTNLVDEKIRYNSLFDLYGALLTEKQREYFSYSYLEDYSLSEIADLLGVSRNAVHDQIKIVLGHLDEFEEKLGLHQRKKTLSALAEQIRKHDPNDAILASIADQIEKTE